MRVFGLSTGTAPRRLGRGWPGLVPGFALAAAMAVQGQELRVTEVRLSPSGSVSVQFSMSPDGYYILNRGDDVNAIVRPTSLRLGGSGIGELADNTADPARSAQFYRVQRVPLAAPLDLDGDGIDDVYELGFPGRLDPLDPRDAQADPDGDGQSTLEEYKSETDPFRAQGRTPTTVSQTSPTALESGVSVNRETILRFSRPLAVGTVLDTTRVYASTGGRKLLGRVRLADDLQSVTLFCLEPLPGATRVSVFFDGNGLRDVNGQELDADGDGVSGGVHVLMFDTFGNMGLSGTGVVGQVFASELATNALGQTIDRPLQGVIVTVDGAEESLRTVTDSEGRFTLNPAPSGRFFVHVDGRLANGSAWPNGAYYPVVGKAWDAAPGKPDNLAGGNGLIYLPLVAAGTLRPVSAARDTVISFPAETLARQPELAGVEITVPANSLFSDSGNRGGRVGIAPVSPDRLPEPLPPGLEMALVITIQTDGPSNFDRPVPARFPNLPDPATGERLPPGAKTALVSFNHDTGQWEVAGPMTITADGLFSETDPGVGIRQPGWHGTSPVAAGAGGGYDGPERGRSAKRSSGGSRTGGGEGDDTDSPGAFSSGEPGDGDGDGRAEAQSGEDDDPPENEGDGSPPSPCDLMLILNYKVVDPFTLTQSGERPSLEFRREGLKGTRMPERQPILGNQEVLVEAINMNQEEDPEGHSIQWQFTQVYPRGTAQGREVRVRADMNYSTSPVLLEVMCIQSKSNGPPCIDKIYFKIPPNSGAHWVSHFGTPPSTSDLIPPFRENAERFIGAMRDAGASVTVSTTFRSMKRAFLMHHSGRMAMFTLPFNTNLWTVATSGQSTDRGVPPEFPANLVADHDPYKGELPINWLHLDSRGFFDPAATQAAAKAMASAYGIVFPAAFPATRHGARLAVDMTISWTNTKTFRRPSPVTLPDGSISTTVDIAASMCPKPRGFDESCNPELWQLGEAYGVKKLPSDRPHWSIDGH